MNSLLTCVLLMAFGTYLSRVLMILIVGNYEFTTAVKRYLRLIPIAILTGIATSKLVPANTAIEPASLVGAGVSLVLAVAFNNLLLTIAGGIVATGLSRMHW